jgi:hypothetical protein
MLHLIFLEPSAVDGFKRSKLSLRRITNASTPAGFNDCSIQGEDL